MCPRPLVELAALEGAWQTAEWCKLRIKWFTREANLMKARLRLFPQAWSRKRLIASVALTLVLLLSAVVVYAYTVCYTYSDGCTICDFYSPKDEHQGSIEWCR